MQHNSKDLSMHYSGFMVLTLGMVVAFFLGMLIVEIPFGVGLGYFHNLQRDSAISKKVHLLQMQYRHQLSQVQVAGYTTNVADECATDFDDCTASYAYELQAGFMTDDEWSVSQAECEAMRDECVADIAGE
jgi:hypothetical protein